MNGKELHKKQYGEKKLISSNFSGSYLRRLRVVLLQPFLSHYREPIYNLLCRQEYPNPKYSFLSDIVNNSGIKTIDFQQSRIAVQNGGLHWQKVSNVWFGKNFLWQLAAIRLALDKDVDCIILLGNMYYISNWIGAILARLTGKRILLWTHGYLREEKGIKGWIREKFYKLSDGLLLYGNRGRQLLRRRGFDPECLYVVYNSLNYEEQCKVRDNCSAEVLKGIRQSLFSLSDLPVLIFVGRLTPQKKLSMLIEAAHILKKKGIELNILFVGDGPERKNFEQLVLSYSMTSNVVFYGACYTEEELGPLFMLSDLCVAPGEIGLTCMHAFAYGIPVVTHDNPDLQGPEWEAIQPGITGELFRYDDVQDLARVIAGWLELGKSRKQLSVDCRRIIDRYYNPSYQAMVINGAVCGVSVADMLDK
ncbi:MAG: glycosyltransferase [Bacteroidetes bacterium]|nr:glycosyltransferase [Bacteroidota bacterium]